MTRNVNEPRAHYVLDGPFTGQVAPVKGTTLAFPVFDTPPAGICEAGAPVTLTYRQELYHSQQLAIPRLPTAVCPYCGTEHADGQRHATEWHRWRVLTLNATPLSNPTISVEVLAAVQAHQECHVTGRPRPCPQCDRMTRQQLEIIELGPPTTSDAPAPRTHRPRPW